MLQAISWKEFLTVMGIATGVYYAWLLFKYFSLFRKGSGDGSHAFAIDDFGGFEKRAEAAKAAATSAPVTPASQQMALPLAEKASEARPAEEPKEMAAEKTVESPPEPPKVAPVNLVEVANDLADEVKALIGQSVKDKKGQPEIMYSLQHLLAKAQYQPLKGTALQEKVTEHIGSLLEKECSIHLDAVGLGSLWKR